jgi:hypothetical protein
VRYVIVILLSILLKAGLCPAGIPSSFARPSISFEPNAGQADPRVMFVGHSGARTIYITKTGLEIAGIELQFRGGGGHAIDIPTYRRVRCEQIYPGISAEFYEDQAA